MKNGVLKVCRDPILQLLDEKVIDPASVLFVTRHLQASPPCMWTLGKI
jgi:hypothetical protein